VAGRRGDGKNLDRGLKHAKERGPAPPSCRSCVFSLGDEKAQLTYRLLSMEGGHRERGGLRTGRLQRRNGPGSANGIKHLPAARCSFDEKPNAVLLEMRFPLPAA